MPILVTDNGPHSAEKWADTTAQMIFPIDPNVEGDRLFKARKVQTSIGEALMSFHQKVMDCERDELANDPDARMVPGFHDVHEHANDALAAVIDVMRDTPWESKTTDPDWQNVVRHTIAQHMADMQHVERRHYADKNPHHEGGAQYKFHYDLSHAVPFDNMESDEQAALKEGGLPALWAARRTKLAQ